jgi:triacylglycerol esterase/lipase EstA (alpha/beta hydrolase family)
MVEADGSGGPAAFWKQCFQAFWRAIFGPPDEVRVSGSVCPERSLRLPFLLPAKGAYMRFRRLRSWGVVAAALLSTLTFTTVVSGTAHAEIPPSGSNDWTCKPSFIHPRPVVLVHGTFENMAFNWQKLSPELKKQGYCVFALNYGGTFDAPIQGTGDIPTSAGQLSTFVDKVLAATKVSKVDMVGHSQGGMMPRYYMKFLGGATKVNQVIGISPSNHGTDLSGLVTLGNLLGLTGPIAKICGPACEQQVVGSAFITNLNAGGDTVPGPKYIVLATKTDEVVTPYTTQFLSGSNAQNFILQDKCSGDNNAHVGIIFDPVMIKFVENTLGFWGPKGPINCSNPLG